MKTNFIFLFIVSMLLISLPLSLAEDYVIVPESDSTGTQWLFEFGCSSNCQNMYGQTFVAPKTGNLTGIKIYIQSARVGGDASIYGSPVVNNLPTLNYYEGNLLGARPVSSFTPMSWNDWVFDTPYPVVAGNNYSIFFDGEHTNERGYIGLKSNNTYANGNKVYNNLINDGWVVSNEDIVMNISYCSPNWVCNGYNSCVSNDTRSCNSVTDTNNCGEVYGGDYSEIPVGSCDYCTPSITNTSWTGWVEGVCLVTDFKTENRSSHNYDANGCYALTGLVSDEHTNVTFYQYRNNVTVCDYCSPSITNTSWTSWVSGDCLPNDFKLDNRSSHNYDANNCYALTHLVSDAHTNLTFYQYRNTTTVCDFCTPDNVCIGYGVCQITNTKPCTTIVDVKTCNENYTGNYSEFTPDTCVYYAPTHQSSDIGGVVLDNIVEFGFNVLKYVPVIVTIGVMIWVLTIL